MKYWWNDADRGKLQYLDGNLCLYHLQFLVSVTTSNSAVFFILPLCVIIIVIFFSERTLASTDWIYHHTQHLRFCMKNFC